MTDWPKVMQVFGSGIIGVYLIMFLLMILVQLADKLVEYFEKWHKDTVPEQK